MKNALLKKLDYVVAIAACALTGYMINRDLVRETQPRLEVYHAPSPSYTLVHIRQQHPHPFGRDSWGKINETTRIHSEIYDLLTNFRKIGITNIYREGLSEMDKDTFLAQIEKSKCYFTNGLPPHLKRKYLFQCGAETLLAMQGKVNLREAEDFVAHMDASLTYKPSLIPVLYELRTNKNESLEAFVKETRYEAREDALLDIISTQYKGETNSWHVTVYGANHNFKDNVERWNVQYPTNQFSLITITPPTIVQREKK